MTTAKRKIHKFDFEKEGAHVALVDSAANLQTVLTMKAVTPEVNVTLSMREFLKKFFYVYDEDARILAGILGYSTEHEWDDDESYDEYIESKVNSVVLLKNEIPKTVPQELYEQILEIEKSVEKALESAKADSLESYIKIVKESVLDKKTKVEISAEELEVMKSSLQEMETLKAQLAEAETLKSQLAAIKQELDTKKKADMTDVVKGYSFVTEDKQAELVEFLMKAEKADLVLEVLEKARTAISEAVIEKEAGVEGDDIKVEETNVDKSDAIVSQILKNRKA